MIQKKYRKKRNIRSRLLAAGWALLVLAAASSVRAQELLPAGGDKIGSGAALGTPVSEMISAADSGGLSGAQNFSALEPRTRERTFENSISADPSPPDPQPSGFTPDSLKNLESQGGLSSDPQISADTPSAFKLAVKFFEQVVFKKGVEFAGRPRFDDGFDISGSPIFDKDTAGYAIIKKENQSVEVDFDHAYKAPPVVTATLSLQQYKDSDVRAVAEDLLLISDVKYIITNVSKKGFEIKMAQKADSDIPFSWHALAVNDPATSKKKGGDLKSVIGSDLGASDSAANGSAIPK